MKKKPGSEFRHWLVRKVSTSVFAFYKDDTDEELAKRIGVQVDVLTDARALFEQRKAHERIPEAERMGHRMRFAADNHRNLGKLFLEPPEEIFEEWVALRTARNLSNEVLLRSVVHTILKTTTQPRWLSQYRTKVWISKSGEWIGQEDIRAHRCRLAGNVGEVALEALRIRARNTGCKPSSIARWAVNLFVHKKLDRSLFIVQRVTGMYKTPEEYCLNPTITET